MDISGRGWILLTLVIVVGGSMLAYLFFDDSNQSNSTTKYKIAIATPYELAYNIGTQNADASIKTAAMGQLVQRLVENLTNSGRFSVLEHVAVRNAISEYVDDENPDNNNDKENMEEASNRFANERHPNKSQPPDTNIRIQTFLNQKFQQGSVSKSSNKNPISETQVGVDSGARSDVEPTQSGSENAPTTVQAFLGLSLSNKISGPLGEDFRRAGEDLGADYFLIGGIKRITDINQRLKLSNFVQGTRPTSRIIEIVYVFRLVDIETMTITSSVSYKSRLSEIFLRETDSSLDEFAILKEVSRRITAGVLDVVSPAILTSATPFVVTRGKQDGIEVGDILNIVRETSAIRDSAGIEIGKFREKVGIARVTSVEANYSVVEKVAGKSFEKGDLAIFDNEQKGGQSEQSTDVATIFRRPEAAPLKVNERSIGRQQNTLPRIAVGQIKFSSTQQEQSVSAPQLSQNSSIETTKVNEDGTEQKTRKVYRLTEITVQESQLGLITDTLISRLDGTRRFRVLERQETDQLFSEQFLAAAAAGNLSQLGFGATDAVDYLVVGNISYFSARQSETKVPGASRTLIEPAHIFIGGNVRLVNVATSDIIASENVDIQFPIQSRSIAWEENEADRYVRQAADAYAAQAAALLINSLYDIRVIGVDRDGQVYLNRGDDGGLSLGETLTVFEIGDEMIDPDTNISMGTDEIRIGEVQISRIDSARSVGVPLGELSINKDELQRNDGGGYIARRASKGFFKYNAKPKALREEKKRRSPSW